MVLKIDEDFNVEHVEMLVENDSYLFYDVEIRLESAKAFKAINKFLSEVEGRISRKFFRRVKAVVAMDWIDLYNNFITQCNERHLKTSKIETQMKYLTEEEKEEAENSETKLEYFDYES